MGYMHSCKVRGFSIFFINLSKSIHDSWNLVNEKFKVYERDRTEDYQVDESQKREGGKVSKEIPNIEKEGLSSSRHLTTFESSVEAK